MRFFTMLLLAGALTLTYLVSGCGGSDSSIDPNPANQVNFKTAKLITTDSTGTVTIKDFTAKQDVYLYGEPIAPTADGWPAGIYYVKVTSSSGEILGKSDGPVITVINGSFDQVYHLWDIVYQTNASGGFLLDGNGEKILGFGNSPDDDYEIWLSTDSTFPVPASKTDIFDAPGSVVGDKGRLQIIKFYDANKNGVNDDDQDLPGWLIHITGAATYDVYTPVSILLPPGTYTISEAMPVASSGHTWAATRPASVNVTLEADDVTTVAFGNVSLGAGGCKSLGYWVNPAGGYQSITNDDLAMFVALHLRNVDGSNFDPANAKQFQDWVLDADLTNLANLLSMQLAALELNVAHGRVAGSELVFAPGTNSANAQGFATISALMAEAEAELALHPTALVGEAWRDYQDVLKEAVEATNKNLSFLLTSPPPFSF